jgi:hypothetical protein
METKSILLFAFLLGGCAIIIEDGWKVVMPEKYKYEGILDEEKRLAEVFVKGVHYKAVLKESYSKGIEFFEDGGNKINCDVRRNYADVSGLCFIDGKKIYKFISYRLYQENQDRKFHQFTLIPYADGDLNLGTGDVEFTVEGVKFTGRLSGDMKKNVVPVVLKSEDGKSMPCGFWIAGNGAGRASCRRTQEELIDIWWSSGFHI